MNKPVAKTITFFDYHECTEYIESKYNIETRDYKDLNKVRDFWHWVTDHHTVHNGCIITFDSSLDLEDQKEWIQDILKLYFKEFGEKITFWVEW